MTQLFSSAGLPVLVQVLAAVLFALGLAVAIGKRNVFFTLMGVELAVNAVALSFIGFARTLPAEASLTGQIAPLFVVAVAAAECCIGLAMVIAIFRGKESVDSDEYSDMRN
jgi:NADH-quinone oxidoreductase subunit K